MMTLQQTEMNLMAHTHTHIHRHMHAHPLLQTTVSSRRTIPRTLKWRFKFHIALHISSATADSFRDETEQKYKKKKGENKDSGLEGSEGYGSSLSILMCKSIYKKKCYKSTRTTLLSTRQIKGRPSPLIVYR